MRQRAQLVEGVQIRAGQAERLALVEIRPQPDVTVCESEHRFGPGERVEVELRLAHRPGLDGESRPAAHRRSSSSAKSETTRSAPARRSASAVTGPIDAHDEAEAARAPGGDARERVLEDRRVARARRSSARAAARKVSGAGFPGRCSPAARAASIRTSNRSARPAASRAARQFALAETTARRKPASRTACTYRTDPSYGSSPSPADQLEHALVLAVAELRDGGGVRFDPACGEELPDAVVARPSRRRIARSRDRSRTGRTALAYGRLRSRRKPSNVSFQAAACSCAVWVSTPSRSKRQARMRVGKPRLSAVPRTPQRRGVGRLVPRGHDSAPARAERRHSRRSTNSIPLSIDRRTGHASATLVSRAS